MERLHHKRPGYRTDCTSVFFLLFGEYKLAGPGFAHGGFQGYLHHFIANGAVSFYRPVLSRDRFAACCSHWLFGWLVETFIGLSLLVGLWARPASVLSARFLLNFALASWWEPGHGVPVRHDFGAELDPLPRLLLFIIFFLSADAGQVWGWDGR